MGAPFIRTTKGQISDISAGIVDAIGTPSFFAKIADMVEGYISFEGLFVFLYSEASAPSSLGCFKGAQNFRKGMENYLRYTYVINPVYRSYLDGVASDAYLISELLSPLYTDQIAASDLDIRVEDNETIGYRTPGWPKNMTEVLALIRLPDNKMIEFSFSTPRAGDQTGQCHARLKEIYPVLSSAVLKHYEFAAEDFDTSTANPSQEHWFQSFGEGVLTKRERSVARMILTGHSSNSIVLNLDISLPTVKTHRRNIYAKLQISSQAELFSLFVQKLIENT
ncbi:MAG: helix-turn-helix transcriptional regulator [Amylibacter sp.]|nr:helix-turn-helix transcriptional regulator [Amylibacter sp.]